MRYQTLATDYDGTLASEGVVDTATVDALRDARTAGLSLILVTGRTLYDLSSAFRQLVVFDRIVAENGAVVYDPATKQLNVLAPPPPRELVDLLAARHVPVSVGRSIIATVRPYEHPMLSTIRDLGLEWHIVFNKGAVMALPSNITKATGLQRALDSLKVPATSTVGMGDAENDHAFMELCGMPVAVANALPAVKADAAFVTRGRAGEGVREVIALMLADQLGTAARPIDRPAI